MDERDFPRGRRRFDRRKKNYKRAFPPNPRRTVRPHRGKSHEIGYIRIPLPSLPRADRGDNCHAVTKSRARIRTFAPSNEETDGWAPEDSPRSFHLEPVPGPSQGVKSGKEIERMIGQGRRAF